MKQVKIGPHSYSILFASDIGYVLTDNGMEERLTFTATVVQTNDDMRALARGVAVLHPIDLHVASDRGFKLAMKRALKAFSPRLAHLYPEAEVREKFYDKLRWW